MDTVTIDDVPILQVLRRTSSSAFTVMSGITVANTAQNGSIKALSVADFDNDGDDDVMVLTDDQGQTQGQYPNLFLCRGQTGNYPLAGEEVIDATTLYTGAQLATVRNATTNLFDVISLLPDNSATTPSVRMLRNTGGGTFGSPTDLAIPTPSGGTTPTPVAVATGRVTGVTAPYIACADFANNRIVVYVDFGGGYQVASSIVVSNSDQIHPTSLVAADLEADGDDDLVVGFDRGNTITVLTCVGRGRFASMTLPSGSAPRFVTAGDVDGNGLPDILEVGGFDNSDSHLRVIFSNCGGM